MSVVLVQNETIHTGVLTFHGTAANWFRESKTGYSC